MFKNNRLPEGFLQWMLISQCVCRHFEILKSQLSLPFDTYPKGESSIKWIFLFELFISFYLYLCLSFKDNSAPQQDTCPLLIASFVVWSRRKLYPLQIPFVSQYHVCRTKSPGKRVNKGPCFSELLYNPLCPLFVRLSVRLSLRQAFDWAHAEGSGYSTVHGEPFDKLRTHLSNHYAEDSRWSLRGICIGFRYLNEMQEFVFFSLYQNIYNPLHPLF